MATLELSAVSRQQRFSRSLTCPICGGWQTARRRTGLRCWGFVSSDGLWAHCTRPEYAGAVDPDATGAFAHRLAGVCRCGLIHGDELVIRPVAMASALSDAERTAAAASIWQRSHPADNTVVGRYLHSRGLYVPVPASLRLARLLRHPVGVEGPVMVAAVTRWPSRQVCAIQRTWIRSDGSGKVHLDPSKMSFGPQRGGAVRLGPVDRVLVVAEGVETALSVQQETGLPAWAVLGASMLPGLVLPDLPLATEIVIAADNDDDGTSLHYARIAAARWRHDGRCVRITLPPPGLDFNDVLMRGAA